MKLRSRIFYTYCTFAIIYVLLTLLPEPAKATLGKYHLHPTGMRLLDVTLIIPELIMWFAIFYGYSKLRRYSQLIKSNQDGRQVAKLADGLLVLAIGVPLSNIIANILALFARSHPGFTSPATIMTNYFDVIFALITFWFIYNGARALSTLYRARPGVGTSHIVIIAVIILGVIFCDLIARSNKSLMLSYHMSYSLVMLTLAIPYMYIWFLGLFAIVEMYEYSRHVSGIVYRKAWNRLAFGLGSIIVIDISLQYLGTLSGWLNGLSLAGLLFLLYVLLLLLAVGFIVVALGAKELMKIEEA